MQLARWLNRNDVRRWLGVLALIVIAIFGQRSQQGQAPGPQAPLPAGNTVEGYPRLVDGDSFHLGRDEVRMKGIDAPEGRQSCLRDGREWRCGEAARDELARLIGGQKVTCRVIERDQHGRMLAHCLSGGRDLNAGMVASGMALAYGGYVKEETAAKLARRGLWGAEFQRPREWRREHGVGGHS